MPVEEYLRCPSDLLQSLRSGYRDHALVNLEGVIDCLAQGGIAEGLEKALHGPRREHARADGIVAVRGDEDDRNGLPAQLELLLQVGPGHARHGDIENQALGLADGIGREKLLGQRESPDREAELPDQIGQRLAHRFIVIDNRHK